MLARSGTLPTRGDWNYEVKWDGFRAIVSTEGAPLRVRSRRGWNMTPLVPELSALPVAGTFDGELVAFGEDGTPDFPLLCEKMLMRRPNIAVTYVVFDRDSRYRPGERGWVKIKNRNYWRYELERESAISKRRVKQFV
jgi:bifunctional non-homologous end joining protein LigD